MPMSGSDLIDSVEAALRGSQRTLRHERNRKRVESLLRGLSPIEREVYKRVLLGRLNKEIARELGITDQTVKAHRARVMKKTQAASPAALGLLSEPGLETTCRRERAWSGPVRFGTSRRSA
ncbi:MAG: response regulator transcription factor [Elusimicrobiota bacterium]